MDWIEKLGMIIFMKSLGFSYCNIQKGFPVINIPMGPLIPFDKLLQQVVNWVRFDELFSLDFPCLCLVKESTCVALIPFQVFVLFVKSQYWVRSMTNSWQSIPHLSWLDWLDTYTPHGHCRSFPLFQHYLVNVLYVGSSRIILWIPHLPDGQKLSQNSVELCVRVGIIRSRTMFLMSSVLRLDFDDSRWFQNYPQLELILKLMTFWSKITVHLQCVLSFPCNYGRFTKYKWWNNWIFLWDYTFHRWGYVNT